MKNLLLIAALVLFTFNLQAQEKPKPNTGETVEKANHNTVRSNRKRSGVADLNTDVLEEDQAGIFERRKCVKAGGTYYDLPNGNKFCMPKRQTADKSMNVSNEQMKGIFERRKCLKSGGIWLTNSSGKMCMKKLDSRR